MADNSLQYLQGQAVDWAATEISVDGQPFSAGFTSLEFKRKLTPEMLYTNGSSDPQARTRGKAEYEGSAEMPTLNYEPLDVMKMELPPGWRGYGAKDYVDHPDTARRLAEVEALKKQFANDRFALQNALLPYADLLPARLRGRNERIDEPLSPAVRPAA